MEKSDNKFSCISSRISVRFNPPIFTPNIRSFLKRLESRGYETMKIDTPTPANEFGSYDISDQIAFKESSIIDFDSWRQYVGVQLLNSDQIVETYYEAFRDFFEDNPSLREHIWFHEYQASYRYVSETSATDRMSDISKNVPIFDKISKTMGVKTSLRGLAISGQNLDPNTENYMDLHIAPAIGESGIYHLVLIYRNVREGSTIDFVKRSSRRIESLLETIDTTL